MLSMNKFLFCINHIPIFLRITIIYINVLFSISTRARDIEIDTYVIYDNPIINKN